MTAFPKPCGRLDHHDPHNWTRHPHHEGGYGGPVEMVAARTFHCAGRVMTEGGYWADWDAADDAAEDELDRQIRDGLAGWGGEVA